MNVKSLVRELLPRRHVAHRIMSGPLRGMKIVTSWHDYPAAILGYTERKLTNWLLANARAGETWFDVGANCGYTSLALARAVGPRRTRLRVRAGTDHGRLPRANRPGQRPAAARRASVRPFRAPRPVVSRFVTERGMIDSQLAAGAGSELTAIIAVGLDAIWDGISGGDTIVHGIKIDVQGMELERFAACAGCWPSIGPESYWRFTRCFT